MSDLIDREQAILAAKAIFKSNSEMKAFCMMKMLEELPAVQTEKVGKWIKLSSTDMCCSECGEIEMLGMYRKYCAYCGAKMNK